MTSRTSNYRRIAATSAVLGALALGAPVSQGQDAPADPRWHAWVGCWRPADLPSEPEGNLPTVCVVPATGTSAVDIVTIVDGEVTAREHIAAGGEQQSATRDGCTGWQRAEWSPDGRRVYLRSEYTCAGNVERASTGLFAMSPMGEWLDVEGVSSGENTGVRVSRYQALRYPDSLPGEVASALPGDPRSGRSARALAGSTVTPADVMEATRHLDVAVVEAWLVEREQGFGLDADRVVALAEAGMPERIIDVMVALSYPRVFAIDRATRQGDFRGPDSTRDAYAYDRGRAGPIVYTDRYGYSSCYSSWYGYSPYGCSRYGYGYGYGYGFGWYPGDRPVVIIVRPDGGQTLDPQGKAVKGRGYTRGNRNSGGSDVSGTRSTGKGSGSSVGSSRDNGRSSGGASGGSGSSTGRTAKPRNP